MTENAERVNPNPGCELTGTERDRVYGEQVARIPTFADYAKNLERTVLVIALDLVAS